MLVDSNQESEEENKEYTYQPRVNHPRKGSMRHAGGANAQQPVHIRLYETAKTYKANLDKLSEVSIEV